MTNKEQAIKLVKSHYDLLYQYGDTMLKFDNAFFHKTPIFFQSCDHAIITVNMAIKELNKVSKFATDMSFENKKEYWQSVKQEILNLKNK